MRVQKRLRIHAVSHVQLGQKETEGTHMHWIDV